MVHVGCLQQWLESRRVSKSNANVTTYYWKHLDCELCKSPLPTAVDCGGGRVVDLLSIEPPEGAFVRLDAIEREKAPGKCIHMISLEDKTYACVVGELTSGTRPRV